MRKAKENLELRNSGEENGVGLSSVEPFAFFFLFVPSCLRAFV